MSPAPSNVDSCETDDRPNDLDFTILIAEMEEHRVNELSYGYGSPHEESTGLPLVAPAQPVSRPPPLNLRHLSATSRVDSGCTQPHSSSTGMFTPPMSGLYVGDMKREATLSPFISPGSVASAGSSTGHAWSFCINPQVLTPQTPAFSGGISTADPQRAWRGEEAKVDGGARLGMPASNLRGTSGPYPRAPLSSPISTSQTDKVKGMTTCLEPPPSPSDFLYRNRPHPVPGHESGHGVSTSKTPMDISPKKRKLDFEPVPTAPPSHSGETAPRPFNDHQYLPPPRARVRSTAVTASPPPTSTAWQRPHVPAHIAIGERRVRAGAVDGLVLRPPSSSVGGGSNSHNEDYDDVSMRDEESRVDDDEDDELDGSEKDRDESVTDDHSQSGESEGYGVRRQSVQGDPPSPTPLRELSPCSSAAGTPDSDYVPLTAIRTRGIGRPRPTSPKTTPTPKAKTKPKTTPTKTSTPKKRSVQRAPQRSTKSKLPGLRAGERRMSQNRNAQKKYRDKNRRLAECRAEFNVETIATIAEWSDGHMSGSEAMEHLKVVAKAFRNDIKATCKMTGDRLEEEIAAALKGVDAASP